MGKLKNLFEEARRIGFHAFFFRAGMVISGKLGIDVRRHPIEWRSALERLEGCPENLLGDPDGFLEWWRQNKPSFFTPANKTVRRFFQNRLDERERSAMVARGRLAARGQILAFRGWRADFGDPPDWFLNPTNGAHWDATLHSKKVLADSEKQRCGDIKFTWELGRFLHIPDVIRAFIQTGDKELVEKLIGQIESFDARNPKHQGPHWASEQEVGIRTCMFALALYSLSDNLDGRGVMLLLGQMAAGADYCYGDIEFARQCIANNHLLAGILGLLVPAALMPWHPRSDAWWQKGRTLLHEALDNQWYPDGGYVQPAHNYHRLGLSYLLWCLRLMEIRKERPLVDRIRQRIGPAFRLLNAMIDEPSGMLPNWGPNDGALFCPWTECSYPDFRPLLTSLAYGLNRTRQYGDGPWDEQLLWLWGEDSIRARVESRPSEDGRFPHAGLHVMRQEHGFAVLRCGPVLSRYGQHADQLHLDLWWHGRNVLLDAGSYSYGHPQLHEWFRGTDSHNTLVIDGHPQMRPYRPFLFLGWPDVREFQTPAPPKGVQRWVGGRHNGFHRLSQKVVHGRLLMELGELSWLVVDLITAQKIYPPARFDLRWHALHTKFQLNGNALDLFYPEGHFSLVWLDGLESQVMTGTGDSADGFHSRHYGVKEPAVSLHLTGPLEKQSVLLTWLGPTENKPNLNFDEKTGTCKIDAVSIDLKPFLKQMRGKK